MAVSEARLKAGLDLASPFINNVWNIIIKELNILILINFW